MQPGDLLYPIGACDQVLYVPGRMRVRKIVPVRATTRYYRGESRALRRWRSLVPTRTTEVVIGSEDTGIMLDRPVPGEVLSQLTYRAAAGPRPGRHVSQDGSLLRSLSVQGIYRLAESSAADLEADLARRPGWPIPLFRPRRHQAVPAGTDTLRLHFTR